MGNVGENIRASNANWDFGGNTCEDFEEHVKKSVPLYEDGQNLICQLSDFFIKDDSLVYDIGCSTGLLLSKLAQHNQSKKNTRWVGIDLQKNMVAYAQKKYGQPQISYQAEDIVSCDLEPCDFISSYYCIQFIHPRVRQTVINKIYQSLNWGGAFVYFEKVRANDARFQDIMTALYTDFKISKGYAAEEILNKQRSLKGVLEPFSTQGNLDLLKRAGFVDIISIAKYICFEGFLCIK